VALSRRKRWAVAIVAVLLVLYSLLILNRYFVHTYSYSYNGNEHIIPDTNGTPVLPHPDFSTQELPTENYNVMTMSVPMVIRGWTENITDHFDMVSNVTRLVVNITGDADGWNMSYEAGTGECPENGTTKVMNPASSGYGCVLDYSPPQGNCEQGRRFIFMQTRKLRTNNMLQLWSVSKGKYGYTFDTMNNPDRHRGEENTFKLNVTVYLPWVK
jgi:hypothetical protein